MVLLLSNSLISLVLCCRLVLAIDQNMIPPGETPQAIRVSVTSLLLRLPGQTEKLSVASVQADGRSDDVSDSSIYSSSDTRVAVVTSNGTVRAIGPGRCTIQIINGRLVRSVSVIVGLAHLNGNGDLNGDGVVDRRDLDILLKGINTPATGPHDRRDLNGDGKIDAVDARILMTLCTRPRCATK